MKKEIDSVEMILRNFCKVLHRKYSKSKNGRARLKYCAPIFKKSLGIWVIELKKSNSNDLFDIRIETKKIDLDVMHEIQQGVEAYLKGSYENAS